MMEQSWIAVTHPLSDSKFSPIPSDFINLFQLAVILLFHSIQAHSSMSDGGLWILFVAITVTLFILSLVAIDFDLNASEIPVVEGVREILVIPQQQQQQQVQPQPTEAGRESTQVVPHQTQQVERQEGIHLEADATSQSSFDSRPIQPIVPSYQQISSQSSHSIDSNLPISTASLPKFNPRLIPDIEPVGPNSPSQQASTVGEDYQFERSSTFAQYANTPTFVITGDKETIIRETGEEEKEEEEAHVQKQEEEVESHPGLWLNLI